MSGCVCVGGGGEHTCPCCTRSKSSQMPCLQSCFEPCSQSLYLDSHWGPYVSGVQSHLLVIQEHRVRVCAFNTRSCLLASVRNVPHCNPRTLIISQSCCCVSCSLWMKFPSSSPSRAQRRHAIFANRLLENHDSMSRGITAINLLISSHQTVLSKVRCL